MSSVTKKDLATNISKKLRLSQKDSLFFVNNFFQFVIDNHKLDINLANFGTFSFEDTPKRIGRNPKTLQKFEIKARKKIKFKPSNKIKKSIN